jgi:hypothetical protein
LPGWNIAAHTVGKSGDGLGTGLANSITRRFTANAVHAITGGAFRTVIARIPLVQFGGARIVVTPSTVAGIALAVMGAGRIASGRSAITGKKLAVDWSWGGAVAGSTEGFILLVAAGTNGIGTDFIVGIILTRSRPITFAGSVAGADALLGAIVVGVLVH